MVKAADTDVLFIALANMEELPAGIIVWLKRGLHANNTLRYVNKKKLHQALGNCISYYLVVVKTLKKLCYNRVIL